MRARSALFDVYGGHLRQRGGAATVAALVRLLEPLGFTAPAVRTAVSRTVKQGWLCPTRLPAGPGYSLTPRGERRMDDMAARIYRVLPSSWDGRWHVVVLPTTPPRPVRERLTSSLQLLGYGELGPLTWVAPRPAAGLPEMLAATGVEATTFHGELDGDDVELARRAWNLDELGARYATFVRDWRAELSTVDPECPADAFATAQHLLHAWRKFLFSDPGLPAELVPADWPGRLAAEFFAEHTARLAPATNRFVEDCLTPPPDRAVHP